MWNLVLIPYLKKNIQSKALLYWGEYHRVNIFEEIRCEGGEWRGSYGHCDIMGNDLRDVKKSGQT